MDYEKNQIESFNNDDMAIENMNIEAYTHKVISIIVYFEELPFFIDRIKTFNSGYVASIL